MRRRLNLSLCLGKSCAGKTSTVPCSNFKNNTGGSKATDLGVVKGSACSTYPMQSQTGLVCTMTSFLGKSLPGILERTPRASPRRVINHRNKLPSEVQDPLLLKSLNHDRRRLEGSSWAAKSREQIGGKVTVQLPAF